MAYKDFEEQRLKHLDLIQGVINRLAGSGFLLKGWAVTLAVAFYGFALNSEKPLVALVGLIPILAFWAIDAYFLRSERLFRALYDQVRAMDDQVTPFAMGATSPAFVARVRSGELACEPDAASWIRTALSRPVLWVFYVSLLVVNGIVIALAYLASSDDDRERWHEGLDGLARLANAVGNAI